MMRGQLICLAVVCSLFPALSFAGIEWTVTSKSIGNGKMTTESSTLMTVNEILFTTFPERFCESPRNFDAEQSSRDSLDPNEVRGRFIAHGLTIR
jgi:hypothetical protein